MTDLSVLSDKQREAYELRASGLSSREAAKQLGITRGSYRDRLKSADRVLGIDPDVARRLQDQTGGQDISKVHSAWLKDPEGDSVYMMFGRPPEEAQATLDEMFEDFFERIGGIAKPTPSYVATTAAPDVLGQHLLVIDPADVHIGKLAVKSEVGTTYNSEVAVTRMREGVRRLIEKARGFGIHRVMVVLGNDILHADRWIGATTAGTPQDTDGLWHQWFVDAEMAYIAMITEIAEEFHVDLVFTPSNHDWQSGFYLARTIKAWFQSHPNVSFSDYYCSPIHRKYYVYSGALIGVTHGDGAKETELPNLMQHEAREHWGATQYAYWYTHHWHHKVRTRYGLKPAKVEKDLTGLTVISPNTHIAGENTEVEVVRSPSAPDGWHHRNGHVNLQAVEAFLHDGSGAQVCRLTEWF